MSRPHAGVEHHSFKNIAVQHSLRCNVGGAGFHACDVTHSIFQGLPMMRASLAYQSAVNIEQHHGGRGLCCLDQPIYYYSEDRFNS